MSTDIQAIETKLAAARTKLILDKPFLGALVLRLPLIAANKDWCPTTATDARGFYFNPDYINGLSLPQTQFMLAHEALHCALSHFARRGHRIRHRWDLACDFAINPLLVEEGLAPPPEAVVLDAYKGMTAEEIYPLLDDNEQRDTLDQHVYDAESEHGDSDAGAGGSPAQPRNGGAGQGSDSEKARAPQQSGSDNPEETGESEQGSEQSPDSGLSPQPRPLTQSEKETLGVQWQQRMAGAAQQALQAGKLGGTLGRLIDHLLQPQLPWRMLLARYLSALARDDFSYMRPSRREGDAIQPSLRSSQINLAVAVDTSGSIKDEEIDEFLAEVDAIKGQIRARVTLLSCDAELAEGSPWVYEPWETLDPPNQLEGGGGTDFRPVFAWQDNVDVAPDLLVYFTDADGTFPATAPVYPVLWLVKGKRKVPWGERIQLN